MSAETDTTSEVARVLAETSRCAWSLGDPKHPYGKDCLDDHPDKHPGVGYCWLLPTRQAEALAEAGLLREFPGRVDGADGGETSNNSECPCAACDPGYDVGFGFRMASRMNVCPNCGNKRCPKAANHAKWQCSGSNDTGQVGVPVEHPQIVTETGPGATQGGSGDSRASGGLGERLRALGTGQTRTLRKALRAMADEADRLENEAELQRHSARSWRVQAEQAQGELRVIEGMSAR